MPEVRYEWAAGATLQEHSKKKHQILRQYLSEYLDVRCRIPQQSRFRLAVIDGFCGGGAYIGGEPGSPVIFLETLRDVTQRINLERAVEGKAQISFECFFVFNDRDPDAIGILKRNLAPLIMECRELEHLSIQIEFMNLRFEQAYPLVKKQLASKRIYRSVFFNLDQCGNTHIPQEIIVDILNSYQSAEVLLTFAAKTIFTFLSRNNKETLEKTLVRHGIDSKDIEDLASHANKREWRAAVERLVFDSYRRCGPYVSPFAINNPDGWLYWLLHFANEPKARQVYNDLLHQNVGIQGHHGRAGLNMLRYDPRYEGDDYLFAAEDRNRAHKELLEDIPNVVSEFGDAVTLADFYRSVSNETPAHSEDIARAMIDHPDLTVRTVNGGKRRSHKGIHPSDVLVLNPQRSFFLLPPMSSK
ncbi:MAG: three-Cys-motif partner protein TcmP [Pseudomonadota bacterium]